MYMDLEAGINNLVIRDGSTTRYTFDDAGHFTATGNVSAYSDVRLKSNIETIESGLDIVCNLRGVTYIKDGEEDVGVIAQEVEKHAPLVVKTNTLDDEDPAYEEMDGYVKTVDYSRISAYLIEAVKELKSEVDALKTQSAGK
jgi:hypothetical protein